MTRSSVFGMAAAVAAALAAGGSLAAGYQCNFADMTNVTVTGGFWLPRFETNRLVTLKADFAKCNETPRIANFTNAANRAWGTFGGIYYDDSDVFKVMEGAAYILATHPDPELERYMTWLIGEVAKAQEPDGYLYTARTLGAERVRKWARWEKLGGSHELYNMGHMIEAAVAWKEATGRDDFLAVARKSADLMCRTFGMEPTQIRSTSGHPEIELALCRLYRATGERRYLDLAKFFLDVRGRSDLRKIWGGGYQDHLPVCEQTEAVGHAVRAVYLYCGMTDVAAFLGDGSYSDAVGRLWENVIGRKLHLNGGVGAHRSALHPKWGSAGEAFGVEYELPNEKAYLETCAAIANALWNVRLFRLYGDAKYMDVAERAIYNNVLSGVSLGGDEFFYPNPLASRGGYKRTKWFGTSCCPVNVLRFIPQVAQFAYAVRGDAAYVNLFVDSDAALELGCGRVGLSQRTAYPLDGEVRVAVTPPSGGARFALNVRVPGWCVGKPVPSDLYAQVAPGSLADFRVSVNGKPFAYSPVKGYCVIDRAWKEGDVVEVSMRMPVRRIKAHATVKADEGLLAVERGPVVYCAEGVDNGGRAFDATIPADATFAESAIDICGQTFMSLKSSGGVVLVPYCAWGNRQPGNEMQTWFQESCMSTCGVVVRKTRD